MALKYRFNLKDIKVSDFKIYLFSLFKAFIPKKKIKNIEDLKEILQSKKRSNAGYSVPANGLFLTKVIYPESIYI